jgi:hypothetical protein
MSRIVRFSGSARRILILSALLLSALCACALGCGEDVLVVNWELRSLSDAGLFGEVDAGSPSSQSESAEEARENAHDRDKNDHVRPGSDEDKGH